MGHHVIRPVERDCICPQRPPVTHSHQCEDAFRLKFFNSWSRERDRFYGAGVMDREHPVAAPGPVTTTPRALRRSGAQE